MILRLLLFLLISFNSLILFSNNEITKDDWEKAVQDKDYTENYKEFKFDSTKFEKKNRDFNFKPNIGAIKSVSLVIIILILAALIVFFIYNVSTTKTTHKIKDITKIVEEVDDPDKYKLTDLERYLNEAINEADFRLALRIRFLMLIKMLNESEAINWKKDKTNMDYYRELQGKEYKEGFKLLTAVFEKVWYANYKIMKTTYDRITTKFEEIQRKAKL